MQSLLSDLRYATRELRKRPGFTLTAVLSLALGIGATSAVFSVIYAVLIDPFPYPGSDRIVELRLVDKSGEDRFAGLSGPQMDQLRQTKSLEDITAMDWWNLTTTDGDLPEDVQAMYISPNAPNHWGIRALMGRWLIPADAPPGEPAQHVVVLTYQFWQRYFVGDPNVVGRTIQLVHKPYQIVGVMPPRFKWGAADMYIPQKITQDPNIRFAASLKIRPGVSPEQASAELLPIIEQFAKAAPTQYPEAFKVKLRSIVEVYARPLGPTLYLLLGAVASLLVIGCANVSILLLARGTERQHELAVRAAVGAGRLRMIRQLLTESLGIATTRAASGKFVSRGICYQDECACFALQRCAGVRHSDCLRALASAATFAAGDRAADADQLPARCWKRYRATQSWRHGRRASRADAAHAHCGGCSGQRISSSGACRSRLRPAQCDVCPHSHTSEHARGVEGSCRIFRANTRQTCSNAASCGRRHLDQCNSTFQRLAKEHRNHGQHRVGEAGSACKFRQPGVLSASAHPRRARPSVGPCRNHARRDARGHQPDHGTPVLAERRRHWPPNQNASAERPAPLSARRCRKRWLDANYRRCCRRARRWPAEPREAWGLHTFHRQHVDVYTNPRAHAGSAAVSLARHSRADCTDRPGATDHARARPRLMDYRSAGVRAAAPGGYAVRDLLDFGAGVGRGWPVQRGFLRSGDPHQRIRHPHGPRC